MRPLRIPGGSLSLNAGPDTAKALNHIGAISIRSDMIAPDVAGFSTAWEPTPQELAAMLAGQPVIVTTTTLTFSGASVSPLPREGSEAFEDRVATNAIIGRQIANILGSLPRVDGCSVATYVIRDLMDRVRHEGDIQLVHDFLEAVQAASQPHAKRQIP